MLPALGNAPVIRRQTGTTVAVHVLDPHAWIMHADGDDVAVAALGLWYHPNVAYLPWIRTDQFVERTDLGLISGHPAYGVHGYGPGDDAYLLGCFVGYEGKARNIVTVRSGMIAALPDEPIRNPKGDIFQESFLIEMRSLNGYSGSPVFAAISDTTHAGTARASQRRAAHEPILLGVDWGHLHYPSPVLSNDPSMSAPSNQNTNEWYVQMNTAMTGVVPAWKIQEILDMDELQETRARADADLGREVAAHPMSFDASDSTPWAGGLPRDEVFDALRKARQAMHPQPNQETPGI
jgi:hypothetical protein